MRLKEVMNILSDLDDYKREQKLILKRVELGIEEVKQRLVKLDEAIEEVKKNNAV